LLWLLAARKKKLLRPLRLLSKHRLLPPPTQLLPQPLPTQPPLLQLLTLLLQPLPTLLQPLTKLLQPRPTLLQPLPKLLTLLRSNQSNLMQNRPAGRFFFACTVCTGDCST
jgi:hypothetical protein